MTTAAPYLRIATEQAYAPPELTAAYRAMLAAGTGARGFEGVCGDAPGASAPAAGVAERVQGLGPLRLGAVDRLGIAHQIVSLTCPGVELLQPERARERARRTNDSSAAATR